MKKILLVLLACFLLSYPCFADCSKDNCTPKKEPCQKSLLDDDEYCIYNQCYFDKKYKQMKRELCLTRQQEAQIDVIYKNFKTDMENQHLKYRNAKNKLLEMIACNSDCQKEQRKALKQIGKETKEKGKRFREDIKDQLCNNQYRDFKRGERREKRILKKLIKYGKIVKLPCVDCCNSCP